MKTDVVEQSIDVIERTIDVIERTIDVIERPIDVIERFSMASDGRSALSIASSGYVIGHSITLDRVSKASAIAAIHINPNRMAIENCRMYIIFHARQSDHSSTPLIAASKRPIP